MPESVTIAHPNSTYPVNVLLAMMLNSLRSIEHSLDTISDCYTRSQERFEDTGIKK